MGREGSTGTLTRRTFLGWSASTSATGPRPLKHWRSTNQDGTDARAILPTVPAPTLDIASGGGISTDDQPPPPPPSNPGAKIVELPGNEYCPDAATWTRSYAGEGFVPAIRVRRRRFDGSCASVLFTDVVGSTTRAAELGDHEWSELIERHHAIVRAMLTRYRGKEINTAGDGFFATFDGPARAVRCAQHIMEAVRPLALKSAPASIQVKFERSTVRSAGSAW